MANPSTYLPKVFPRPEQWHRTMYDDFQAERTLDSDRFHRLAENEVAFLIKTLGLPPGAGILDVPCGAGRHAALLAKAGYRVTGVDINPEVLRRARRNCRGLPVALKRGDMAKLGRYRGRFDALVNLYSSFGYFATDAANERVLKGMVAALKPGGRLVLQLMNPLWLEKSYRPLEWKEEKGRFLLMARHYNPKSRYHQAYHVAIDPKRGTVKRHYHRVRLYPRPEMVSLLRRSGLERIRVYGGHRGERFDPERSSHPFYIARKPGKR